MTEFSLLENETAMVCVNLSCPDSSENIVEVDVYSNDRNIARRLTIAS